MFDEAEQAASEEDDMSVLETAVKAHTRKAKKTLEEKLKGIPVEQVIHDIPKEERICDICGSTLEEIGREVVRRELEYIPAKVKVIEHVSVYGYTPTRGGYNAGEFLEGFSGYLETDGYQGYNKVPGITRCCCWAHVRRYFIEAVPKGREYDYSNPAVQGVSFCNELFKYEDKYKKQGLSYEKRGAMRLEQEKTVLDAFWSWLDNQHPVRNSRMDKAVTYVRNRKPFLETYLEDGRCRFSNNLSENAIRPFTVGRKNWLFSESQAGVEASAIVYSIVEMAKAHDLNIYKYLKFLLEQRPNSKMTDEQLSAVLPWNKEVIETCHN